MKQLVTTPRRPAVAFYPDGRIEISSRMARLLSLCPGDVISILADGADHFLAVAHRASEGDTSSYALRVSSTKRPYRTLRCHCKAVTDQIRQLFFQSNPSADSSMVLRCPSGKVVCDPQHGTAVNIITRINIPKP